MNDLFNRPLRGIRIVEFEGIGPSPVTGHILQQLGASVTLICRPNGIELADQIAGDSHNPLLADKDKVPLDLRNDPLARERALTMIADADVVIEGLRPGVMERLSLGPADCAAVNGKLVYARVTGWGQTGPLKDAAGHDLNYVALSGLLSLSGRKGQSPIIPPASVGDVSGAVSTAFGVVCALFDIRGGGQGRVVDGAVVDATIALGIMTHWLAAIGQLSEAQPSVFHDSPFYDVYECADGKYVTLGALEPKFYAELLERLGLTDIRVEDQYDSALWPETKAKIAEAIRGRTRDEWCDVLEGTDVCFAPVLSIAEAASHPHNVSRDSFRQVAEGMKVGRVAPRFLPLQ